MRTPWQNVYVMDASAPEQSHAANQGHYTLQAKAIRFTPLYPFTAGQPYRVEWRDLDAPNTPLHVVVFRLTDNDRAAPPQVVGIAPTAPTLPANTLRFYITFSRSLRGVFDRHMVRLADEPDHDITNAFMEFGQELSCRRTRLTLLFDPGRIKRGVTANRTAGSPLVPGHRYTLAVSLPNGPKFAATFRVSGPLHTLLDPNPWHLAPPKAGTRAPLVVRFDRTMDEVLLRHAIAVYSVDGKQIAGTAASANGARNGCSRPWRPGVGRRIAWCSVPNWKMFAAIALEKRSITRWARRGREKKRRGFSGCDRSGGFPELDTPAQGSRRSLRCPSVQAKE